MTYNVHGCVGSDAQLSHERIADVIAMCEPDIVGLQEVDVGRARSHGVDQAQAIAERLGMTAQFASAFSEGDGHYGNAMLSRFPMQAARVEVLPGRAPSFCHEARVAQSLSIQVNGIKWQLINTHFGLGRAERREQATALASWTELTDHEPSVLCGDFNSRPGSAVHRILSSGLRNAAPLVRGINPRTYPARMPLICLDYIYVSSAVEVRHAEAPRNAHTAAASDHLPLLIDVEFTPREAAVGAAT